VSGERRFDDRFTDRPEQDFGPDGPDVGPADPQDIHRADARISGPAAIPSPDTAEFSTAHERDSSTVDDLPSANTDPTSTDLASNALQAARAIASGRPAPATGFRRRRRARSEAAGYSGSGPDGRDPVAIGAIVGQSIDELGWTAPLAEARLHAQWASVVGAEIGARCQPVSLRNGELRIAAESTAWATQLRLLAPQLLKRICAELPAGMVTRLHISGPSAPSWKRGPWSMRGGRGVRDTYG
jgi:predicted nucleic acid-binding Zn ribbon protein